MHKNYYLVPVKCVRKNYETIKKSVQKLQVFHKYSIVDLHMRRI